MKTLIKVSRESVGEGLQADTLGMVDLSEISEIQREKLYTAGWRVEVNDERGVFVKHPRMPGHMLRRSLAATVQAAWDAERRGEVA